MTSAAPSSLWTGPRDDPNRYRVDLEDGMLVEVGGGGEGLVYAATAVSDRDRLVALKLFTSVAVDRFPEIADAARRLAQVRHPNLMRPIEAFCGRALGPPEPAPDEDFDVIYLAAEWIDGEPLDAIVRCQGVAAGLHRVGDVARACAALHDARGPGEPDGIVHGDVKPSNVRVARDGRAILLDFAIGLHRPGDGAVGTYGWRAPEVRRSETRPVPASDAWGVGALAHWVIVGEPPGGDDHTEARERIADMARERGFLNSHDFGAHIAGLLEPDPASRPRDLERWADTLDRLVHRRTRVPWSRRPGVVATAAAILGIVLGVAITVAARTFDDWATHSTPTPGAPGSVLRLARPFAVPDSRPDDVVLRQDHVVRYEGGPVALSGNRGGSGDLLVNDEIELQVTHADGSIARHVHNFASSTNCATDQTTGPQDLSGLFAPGRNIVRVVIRGGCDGGDVGLGGFAGAGTPVWLVFRS